MAKTNGDPFGIANAGKNDKYMGQLATRTGPKTMPSPVDMSVVDKDIAGSAQQKETTKIKAG